MDRIPDYSPVSKLNEANDKIKILVVDDEEGMCLLLEDILKGCGYPIDYFTQPGQALTAFKNNYYPLVFTDIKMPEIDGMALLKEILAINKNTSVIMITAYGSIENAVECMDLGAFNYITKPFKSGEIIAILEKAVERINLIRENIQLKKKLESLSATGITLIGKSAQITGTLAFAKKIAQTNFKVLITGESGTGKELIARYIHTISDRRHKPFIPIQCSLLPETLLESELFGHKKGSFTGAHQDKKGLFEEANQGTIFLDEIGDINPNVQGKLLRFLEEKEVKRIGDVKSRIVDIRLIFATNKNLQKLVNEKQFRDDLFYRIREIEIKVPPLRERKEDIPLLTRHFLEQISMEIGEKIEIEREVFDLFMSYDWAGNVRELKNCLASAAAMCNDNRITVQEISKILLLTHTDTPYHEQSLSYREMKKKMLEDFNRKYINNYLAENRGNITRTAKSLGIDKKNLWMLIKKYNIDCSIYK
ncbi:MAG: sigma-54-dependent Fis family transcriptional regulator [Spirochaetales bacterium]|nr:sigma-54-dependent Fis family transcriptional regulator [Spirochaetales bacterium]